MSNLAETRILIIDNPKEAKHHARYLKEAGFTDVSELTSKHTDVDAIREYHPDVIIVNCYFGLALFHLIRQDNSLASTEFIVTCPQLDEQERENIAQQGIKHILQRPYSTDVLREIILGLFGVSGANSKEQAEEFFHTSMDIISKGDYENTLTQLKRSLDSHPDADYFLAPALCYIAPNVSDKVQAALSMEGRIGDAQQTSQDAFLEIKALKRATQKDDVTAEIHVDLGKAYLGVDMIPDADHSFETAIKMEPENVPNRKNIGAAYLQKGLYDKAEKIFDDAIKITPGNIQLYISRAISFRKQGKYQESIDIYLSALNIDPNDEGIFFNLARVLIESGERKRGIKAIEQALKIDPEFEEANVLLKKMTQ
jgi:tetratricopeptide (TPR) repeat protein